MSARLAPCEYDCRHAASASPTDCARAAYSSRSELALTPSPSRPRALTVSASTADGSADGTRSGSLVLATPTSASGSLERNACSSKARASSTSSGGRSVHGPTRREMENAAHGARSRSASISLPSGGSGCVSGWSACTRTAVPNSLQQSRHASTYLLRASMRSHGWSQLTSGSRSTVAGGLASPVCAVGTAVALTIDHTSRSAPSTVVASETRTSHSAA